MTEPARTFGEDRDVVGDLLTHRHLVSLAETVHSFLPQAYRLADWGAVLAGVFAADGRVLAAGNGGSAAEAQHLCAELVGKMREDRRPLSAIALTAESSSVTAISNDYGYEEVFARQVRAHGRPGDVLVTLSTSGRSPNLLAAVRAARAIGMHTWAITGPAPNPLAEASEQAVTVPSEDSQTVQELHLASVHLLCAHVEVALADHPTPPLRRVHVDGAPANGNGHGRAVDGARLNGNGGRPRLEGMRR
jgi:D-sedoheptulose 7-phosphate isomerase